MLYKKRKSFSGTSKQLGKSFSFLSGNAWTVIGLLLTVVSAYFLTRYDLFTAAILLFLGVACDFIDGSVARYRKESSNIGAYYDTIADRYAEGVIVISLFFIALPALYLPSSVWIGLYLFGSMMTTYVKAAAKEKLDIEVTGGILERPERMILLVIGIWLGASDVIYISYVLVILAILTNVSALQRLYMALHR